MNLTTSEGGWARLVIKERVKEVVLLGDTVMCSGIPQLFGGANTMPGDPDMDFVGTSPLWLRLGPKPYGQLCR